MYLTGYSLYTTWSINSSSYAEAAARIFFSGVFIAAPFFFSFKRTDGKTVERDGHTDGRTDTDRHTQRLPSRTHSPFLPTPASISQYWEQNREEPWQSLCWFCSYDKWTRHQPHNCHSHSHSYDIGHNYTLNLSHNHNRNHSYSYSLSDNYEPQPLQQPTPRAGSQANSSFSVCRRKTKTRSPVPPHTQKRKQTKKEGSFTPPAKLLIRKYE